MRYITDSDGWLRYVSFGADITCRGLTCTEYTGALPVDDSGDEPVEYSSLEAWYLAEAETLHRWRVVDGDLTLDLSCQEPAPDKVVIAVENGGTGATTADGALINLGAGPRWEVLWENTAPNDAFAEQTLHFEGLDGYNEFEITWKVKTTIDRYVTQTYYCHTTADYIFSGDDLYWAGSTWQAWKRLFWIRRAAGSMIFHTGKYISSGSGDDDAVLIPQVIRAKRVVGANKDTAVLGRAILGLMILGKGG